MSGPNGGFFKVLHADLQTRAQKSTKTTSYIIQTSAVSCCYEQSHPTIIFLHNFSFLCSSLVTKQKRTEKPLSFYPYNDKHVYKQVIQIAVIYGAIT
jgi:hypothetical protein